MHPFFTPWKQNTVSFLFSGVREKVHWEQMGQVNLSELISVPSEIIRKRMIFTWISGRMEVTVINLLKLA